MTDTRRLELPGGVYALVDSEDYDRVSGFSWHTKTQTSRPGTIYVQRTVRLDSGRQSSASLHREIMRAEQGVVVDHINGDGLDNRKANLRVTTIRGNNTNVTSSKNQKRGGYKGVSWNRNAKAWEAGIGGGEIKSNGKRKREYLGLHDNAADAARAYDRRAREVFGEFASLNFPGDVEP